MSRPRKLSDRTRRNVLALALQVAIIDGFVDWESLERRAPMDNPRQVRAWLIDNGWVDTDRLRGREVIVWGARPFEALWDRLVPGVECPVHLNGNPTRGQLD